MNSLFNNYIDILKSELIFALGCTEPIAIALASAKAREALTLPVDKMVIACSGNIVKNVKSVVVPNSNGQKGIAAAAILGLLGGNAEAGLEVLENVSSEHIINLNKLLKDKDFCTCELIENVENLYIIATVYSGTNYASVEIKDQHTNIVKIIVNDKVLLDTANLKSEQHHIIDKSLLSVKNIIKFANEVNLSLIEPLINKQISANIAISQEGLTNDYGAGVGKTLLKHYGNDIKTRAKAATAAGSDARMSGCALPVVINSGSGNQGMTVSLPVIEYAKELQVSHEKLVRALLLSNLISILQKRYIGSLSAYCGAVSAACGSGAAIAYLYNASYEQICKTIVNTLANVAGIVCDGAKASCAAKIASAVDAAIMGYLLSLDGKCFAAGEGIVKEDIEKTIEAIGHIGKEGMRHTDIEILKIMLDNS